MAAPNHMQSLTTNRDLRKPTYSLTSVVAFLCILLILIVGAAQLLHTHNAGDETVSSGCSLCAVAHLAAIFAPTPAGLVKAESIWLFTQAVPAEAPPRYFARSLYVRPPPVLTAFA